MKSKPRKISRKMLCTKIQVLVIKRMFTNELNMIFPQRSWLETTVYGVKTNWCSGKEKLSGTVISKKEWCWQSSAAWNDTSLFLKNGSTASDFQLFTQNSLIILVCVCVCIYIYIYIYIYVCVCAYVQTFMQTNIHIHSCMYVCIHIYRNIHVLIYEFIYENLVLYRESKYCFKKPLHIYK